MEKSNFVEEERTKLIPSLSKHTGLYTLYVCTTLTNRRAYTHAHVHIQTESRVTFGFARLREVAIYARVYVCVCVSAAVPRIEREREAEADGLRCRVGRQAAQNDGGRRQPGHDSRIYL